MSPSPTEKLQDALRLHAGPETEEVFVTSAQQFIAQGRAEARAATLLRLLERKFGRVDDAARARVAAASSDELDAYLDRILFAQRSEEVFEAVP